MAADDDSDCPHDWLITDVMVTGLAGADTASVCALCGGVRYEAADNVSRPPLGGFDAR